jgi:hypothetical protein
MQGEIDPRVWMSIYRDKHPRPSRRGLVVAMLAALAVLGMSSSALAGQDKLKGGSVVIKLQGSRGLKLKPSSLNLPITGGAVDPVNGSGTVQVNGSIKFRRGKGKTKVKITALNLGANGGRGTISAKVGKRKVGAFGTLLGGTVARDGWGAKIDNVKATLASKGAQALNRAFSPRKGGAKKSAGGGVKAGQPLGTVVSIKTDPLSVEVVPGSGSIVLNTNAMGAFVTKLSQHCIDPLPTGSPPGVAPIAPATANILGTVYTFPVTGGAVAPDFSAGELVSGGGQVLTKNTSILNPSACGSADPPLGTQLLSNDFTGQFDRNALGSNATLPNGTSIVAALATIDWSTGTRSIDPNTKQLTVTGATLALADVAAFTLNQIFPNESGTASNDFAPGDGIGTVDMSATLR